MNAILHGANTCTPKKQASQLIVELGKSISNPQRQTLANLYIAVDTANSLLKELEQAHQIIRECMNDEQILEVAKLNQNNNLSSLWAFRTHQRHKLIERAQRVLFGAGHVPG